jgi:hypothetical protein
MTLKEVAHLAQQTLQTATGCPVKRSHVHEFLAAAFGHGSWAAFRTAGVLADAGVGAAPAGTLPQLTGRAVQLGYGPQAATSLASGLLKFIVERQISAVSWADLHSALLPPARTEDDDDDDDAWDDEAPQAGRVATGPAREHLMKSPMLLSSLEHAAGPMDSPLNPPVHFMIAVLCRCLRPNPYLYEESLKGRELSTIERGWVADYLRLEPQYRRYEAHLKAAALGGVRAAALEYGTAFENPEFIALAERLTGEVDAMQMARHAPSKDARQRWLRTAAEQGSRSALESLADAGDAWAEDQVAQWADVHWLRSAAERALDAGDASRAWTWQYLAMKQGEDLTRSTMRAYHDGGERNGQFYDSDFGGPLYADGSEGLVLPDMDRSSHRAAIAKAKAIFSRAR